MLDHKKTSVVGGYGASKIHSSLWGTPRNLPFILALLVLLSLEATMLMSECGGISALTCWLEWFGIVLWALLEVWREVCAYRYDHEHIYYLQIYT